MEDTTTRRKRYLLHCAGAALASGTLLGLTLGAPGLLAAAAFTLLFVAWRFDNHTGSCLMVTLLFVLALGALLMLFALAAIQR